ncbi:MAG TPA: hypothetical protein VMU38_06545 [Candidatus Binatia bacterium]|nr:hypothetical protein [Candidatus Binatia bacterium]
MKRAAGSPFVTADVTALLLGHDLWFAPLAGFRDQLIRTGERPHLWTFDLGPSGSWDSTRWRALSPDARVLRARTGAVDRRVRGLPTANALQIDPRLFVNALSELAQAGLYDESVKLFAPVGSVAALHTDLSLVQILAHWLVMLRHRERVLADRHATGLEVHGYAEACSRCRERWGLRPFEPRWAPPFHPGCRCFAQPRFA